MVAEYFPKHHKRAGDFTDFCMKIKHHIKTHTIRYNYDLWERRISEVEKGKAYISVRIWDDKPYRSPQLEIFRFDNTHGVGIEAVDFPLNAVVNDCVDVPLKIIAYNDGLTTNDFKSWFNKPTKSRMAIIHFTNFRYDY